MKQITKNLMATTTVVVMATFTVIALTSISFAASRKTYYFAACMTGRADVREDDIKQVSKRNLRLMLVAVKNRAQSIYPGHKIQCTFKKIRAKTPPCYWPFMNENEIVRLIPNTSMMAGFAWGSGGNLGLVIDYACE